MYVPENGELVYFIPNRGKKIVDGRYRTHHNSLPSAIARVTSRDFGFFPENGTQYDAIDYTFTAKRLLGKGNINIYTLDGACKFPIQSKGVLEQIIDGDIQFQDVVDKEVVIITDVGEYPTPLKDIKSFTLLPVDNVLSVYTSCRYNVKSCEKEPLQPVYATLRKITKELCPLKDRDGNPMVGGGYDYRFILKIPYKSCGSRGNKGTMMLSSHYASYKAMMCMWFKEDYDAYVKMLPRPENREENDEDDL